MTALLAIAVVLLGLAWKVHAWFLATLFFLVTSARVELRKIDEEGTHARFVEMGPTLWLGVAVAGAVVPRLQARTGGRLPPFGALLDDGVTGGLALGGAIFLLVTLVDGIRHLLGHEGGASEGDLGLPLVILAFVVVASNHAGLAGSAPGRLLVANAAWVRVLLMVPCAFLLGRLAAGWFRPRVAQRDPAGPCQSA